MVTLTINGQTVQVPAGTTILEAAEKAGIKIPTLCYLKDINKIAACRMCVVEVEGNPKLVKACATEIAPNMVVRTKTKRVLESRKTNLELVLSTHAAVEKAPRTFDAAVHHVLARRAAAESIVLLKNEDGILPLKAGEKLAVIGDFAQTPRYQGAGSSAVNSIKVDSVLEQLAADRPDVTVAKVDVDENMSLAAAYGVESIPMLLVFKNGQLVNKSIGFVSQPEIEKLLQ